MGAQLPQPLRPERAEAVIKFLVRVAAEPELRAEYGRDADGAMMRGGLKKAERDLILKGPLARIQHALGAGVSRIKWQPPTVWA